MGSAEFSPSDCVRSRGGEAFCVFDSVLFQNSSEREEFEVSCREDDGAAFDEQFVVVVSCYAFCSDGIVDAFFPHVSPFAAYFRYEVFNGRDGVIDAGQCFSLLRRKAECVWSSRGWLWLLGACLFMF